MNVLVRGMVAALALIAFVGGGERAIAQDSLKVERPSADLITRAQIADSKVQNAYDAVESLHSNWLVERIPKPVDRASARDSKDTTVKAAYVADYNAAGKSAPGAAGGIQVYFDGTRIGGTDELKTMRASEIYSIRRYSGTEASGRFGIGHSAGVIFVSSVTYAQKSKP
ncbi:MAG: hypothetical protein V4550_02815 [Gemmatimonadota bacterium]